MNYLKSFIIYFLAPLVVLSFIYWIGWSNSSETKTSLVLADSETGTLGKLSVLSPPVMRDFDLLNTGRADVTISKIYTNCSCLLVTTRDRDHFLGPYGVPVEANTRPIDIIVAGGESQRMSFEFNPKGLEQRNQQYNIFVETKNKEITKIPVNIEIVE